MEMTEKKNAMFCDWEKLLRFKKAELLSQKCAFTCSAMLHYIVNVKLGHNVQSVTQ